MPRVVRVRLRHPVSLYDFDAGDLALSRGNWVIVETTRGQDAGQVASPPREAAEEELKGELKPVVRLATETDLRRMERFREKEEQVLATTREKVAERGLPMRLIAAEYTYNGRSLTIYFTAEKRVDFRELVKELAREFRTRIELRQIGARDEARLLGGVGPCGRLLCCTTFLRDFLRISVRMAKEQDLPLNPIKISGACGRLLCCLSYECEQYRDIKAELPEIGEEVATLRGKGKVVGLSVPRERASVEVRPGVTVEATVEDLARAAQLQAGGEISSATPAYEAECATPPGEQAEAAPATGAEAGKRRGRRRRRRRKPELADGRTREETPPSAASPPPSRREGRRHRSQEKRAQAEETRAAASQQKDSSPPRRRRPRRHLPKDSPGRGP